MSPSTRFSTFLSTHPRLLQLVTVTPVAPAESENAVEVSDQSSSKVDGEPVLHEEPAVDSAGDAVSRLRTHKDLDEAFLTEVLVIVERFADSCSTSSRRRRIKAEEENEAVEAIRALSQIVVWGDQNNPSLWDIFMAKQTMHHLTRIVKFTTHTAARRQCLQSISIMVQSFQNETSLYNLFSRNYINEILSTKYDLDDLEMVGQLVSIIRGITNKLNKNVLQFFFDDDHDSFPLYEKATELFDHREAMFRIAVRNATLSIYNLGDERVLDYVTRDVQKKEHYFNKIFSYANSIEETLTKAFVKATEMDLPKTLLQRLEDNICEMESVLEYVNESISTNEANIGAFLGGAAIREFVQPPLFEIAAYSPGREYGPLQKKMEARAGIFSWHVAICLQLLSHELVGRAMTVEILSAFSENGRTPCQGLKILLATSKDERSIHLALCAMEALITYPLSEYDDLIAAGFAVANPSPCAPSPLESAGTNSDDEIPMGPDELLSPTGSGILRHNSSSLSGYDFVTGNQLPKSATMEDKEEYEDKRNYAGLGFREVIGTIFRLERATRSMRVAQATARVVLAVANDGGEEVKKECSAVAAVLLTEYICNIRAMLEDDRDSIIPLYEAVMASSKSRAMRPPTKLRDTIVRSDILVNKGLHHPAEKEMEAERVRRRRRRYGLSVEPGARRPSKALDLVRKQFLKFDAHSLLVLTWLTAELRGCQEILPKIEEEFQTAPKEKDAAVVKQFLHRLLEVLGGTCTY